MTSEYTDIEMAPEPFPAEVGEATHHDIPHILACLHGIRDDGRWGNLTFDAGGRYGDVRVEVHPLRFNRVSTLGFLIDEEPHKELADVKDQLDRLINRFPASPLSIICHSFGTKVLALLLKGRSYDFEWIFLCSSVAQTSDVATLALLDSTIVSDAAEKDIWPIMAEACRPDRYQATGVFGFNRSPVIDRSFPCNHGKIVSRERLEEWVIPILARRELKKTNLPTWGFKIHVPVYLSTVLFPLTKMVRWLSQPFRPNKDRRRLPGDPP